VASCTVLQDFSVWIHLLGDHEEKLCWSPEIRHISKTFCAAAVGFRCITSQQCITVPLQVQNVAASTQNRALSALHFPTGEVLSVLNSD